MRKLVGFVCALSAALLVAWIALAPPRASADDAGSAASPDSTAAPPATSPTTNSDDMELTDNDEPAFSTLAHHVSPVPEAEIDNSISRGVDYLYSMENKQGNWEAKQAPGPWKPQTGYETSLLTDDVQFGGTTALCVYALLSAGESPDDPRLSRAIEFLKTAPMHGIYAASLRLNAFALLGGGYKRYMQKDEELLQRSLVSAEGSGVGNHAKPGSVASGTGMYCYSDKLVPGRPDHSVSQFGVLGMWMAQQAGFNPDDEYWHSIESAWLRDQMPDGGWCYVGQTPPETGSMSAAGVATLFIAEDELHSLVGLNCKGNAQNPAIRRGLKWLEAHFVTDHNPGMDQAPFYYLFAVQRVGVASGYRYFGKHDWYNEGARALLGMQTQDGSWPLETWLSQVHTSAFAILFLARGNRPQLVNKLEYDGRWDQRPRDAANLTRYFGTTYEQEFNWQIVNVDGDADDFHNAPLLYVSGHGALNFSDAQKSKLRLFVEGGGILLGNADCADSAFADSFQKLMRDLFPQYPPRQLPPNDLIFSYNKLKVTPQVIGQSNGVRELALLLPKADLGRDFQRNHPRETPESFDAGIDICLYASDPGTLERRNRPYYVFRDATITRQTPGWRQVKLARIEYNGNWNPEPGGWQRMSNILHNQYAIDLDVHAVKLGDGHLPDYRIAHLTGTDAITFSDAQTQDIKLFLARGGTLIIDAAGGSQAFAASMEKYLNALIPPLQLQQISMHDPLLAAPSEPRLDAPLSMQSPATHPTTSGAAATQAVKSAPQAIDVTRSPLFIAYRHFARTRLGRSDVLRLDGIKYGNRWMVVYSPVDLSTGLVGQNVDGIVGYAPATATEIVRRVIAHSIGD